MRNDENDERWRLGFVFGGRLRAASVPRRPAGAEACARRGAFEKRFAWPPPVIFWKEKNNKNDPKKSRIQKNKVVRWNNCRICCFEANITWFLSFFCILCNAPVWFCFSSMNFCCGVVFHWPLASQVTHVVSLPRPTISNRWWKETSCPLRSRRDVSWALCL